MVWTTALLAAVGGAASFAAWEVSRWDTADFLDGQLRQIALNAGEGLPGAAPLGAPADPDEEFAIAIWAASGEALRMTKHAASLPRSAHEGFATVRAADEEWRVYLASDGRRSVQAAQRMSVRDEIAQTAAIQAALPVLGVIPLAWLVIGWSITRVLRPVAALAKDIAGRDAEKRTAISVAGAPQEIIPLIEAMNALALRLQRALEAQKTFVADAAHALKTPLTALRIQAENLRADILPGGAADFAEMEAGVRRASGLVEQLLRLARAEAVGHGQFAPIDLSDVLRHCVADLVPLAGERSIDLGLLADVKLVIEGSEPDLAILFSNLVDNAVRHAPPGAQVDVSVFAGEDSRVEILDSGPGVPAAEIPKLFDRFHRAANAREAGNGLGLAIADAIARRHGLRIEVENRKDRSGLRVTVRPPGRSVADGGAS